MSVYWIVLILFTVFVSISDALFLNTTHSHTTVSMYRIEIILLLLIITHN